MAKIDLTANGKDGAVVMAAALAARDYEGEDRRDVIGWCAPILDEAADG